jgi:hypothetical protein
MKRAQQAQVITGWHFVVLNMESFYWVCFWLQLSIEFAKDFLPLLACGNNEVLLHRPDHDVWIVKSEKGRKLF